MAGGVMITAKRPVTVTEQEMVLGDALFDELIQVFLGLETDAGTTPTRAHRALAHRRLRAHYEQVIAEEQLEVLAVEHKLECELLRPQPDNWLVIPAGQIERGEDLEPLATGDTPLAAVLELQRDLDAAETARISARAFDAGAREHTLR